MFAKENVPSATDQAAENQQDNTEQAPPPVETTNPETDPAPEATPTTESANPERQSPLLDRARATRGMEAPPTNPDAGNKGAAGDTPQMLAATGRLPSITPNMAEFGQIPSAPKNVSCDHKTMPARGSEKVRTPNQMAKIATVTMTNKSQREAVHRRNNVSSYVDSRRTQKVVTWDQAMTSRPPLRIDMDGPTPCSYSPRNKPLWELNAPAWSFGRKTFVERDGGARTSWEKTWFQSGDVWTQKADFFSDRKWPAPPTHPQRHSVGAKLPSGPNAPHHTFGYRRQISVGKQGSEDEPSPNEYNIDKSSRAVLKRAPAFSHSFRRGGTALWSYTETTPGPGTYRPERSTPRIKTHHPSFSIRGMRREQTHELGPFAAF